MLHHWQHASITLTLTLLTCAGAAAANGAIPNPATPVPMRSATSPVPQPAASCPEFSVTQADFDLHNVSEADRAWLIGIVKAMPSEDQGYIRWTRVAYNAKSWIVAYISANGLMDTVISDTGLRRGTIDLDYRNVDVNHLYIFPCSGDEFAGPPEG
jgi:hypothetical protein